MSSSCARLVIAGVSSNVGKTTVTCALALALRRQGLKVVTFKCGPDYLDPTYHARAAGQPAHNLDGWMMGREAVLETFERVSAGHDIALIEGVMGLYDGADPESEEGSTAQIAKWLQAPVLLVIDGSGMARSFAAVLHGFRTFDEQLHIPAVLANRVGSEGHLALLRRAAPREVAVFGLPKQPALAFPERHLGLRTADGALPDSQFAAWADTAEKWLDLAAIRRLATTTPVEVTTPALTEAALTRCRIGVAYDEAFHFYYDYNLAALEASGAQLVRFSPCRDGALPDVDGLYLGGGYPELHAHALQQNSTMRSAIAAFAERGGPIYAECGGLMYLSRAIHTREGERFEMVGLFEAEAHMADKLRALGYTELTTTRDTLLGPTGLRLRGHQFRYSELRGENTLATAYEVRARRTSATGREGYVTRNVLASYVHVHWGATPHVARTFVDVCADFGGRR